MIHIMSFSRAKMVHVCKAFRPHPVQARADAFSEDEIQIVHPIAVFRVAADRFSKFGKSLDCFVCRLEKVVTLFPSIFFILLPDEFLNSLSCFVKSRRHSALHNAGCAKNTSKTRVEYK